MLVYGYSLTYSTELPGSRPILHMSTGFMSIFATLFVIFSLLMAPCSTINNSRDLLLTFRGNAVRLNHRVRRLVSQLGLSRRGCRAGAHCRRRLLAAQSVTSSTSLTCFAGEIPAIIGHRYVNNDQLFQGHCHGCVPVCNVQSDVSTRHSRRRVLRSIRP